MAGMWLFFMALAVVYLLPGPDMILLLQTGARQGKGAALATAVGLGIARGCHVALAALGLVALFKAAPWTFDVVRLVGAAYLLWIGIQCLRTTLLPNLHNAEATTGKPHWREAIQRGLLTNLLNPKALLFCSVLLPQFVRPEAGPVALQMVELGLVLLAIGACFDVMYAIGAARIAGWMRAHPLAQTLQRWTFSAALIGFALRLSLD
jgi:threonine/homoserine/homoserine lactone efflux protein